METTEEITNEEAASCILLIKRKLLSILCVPHRVGSSRQFDKINTMWYYRVAIPRKVCDCGRGGHHKSSLAKVFVVNYGIPELRLREHSGSRERQGQDRVKCL